ncbi:hypothetical protein OOK31_21310 [Streptomyces sp. NBC_00249]|uniref:hypothetical protein n=1 Tax=Streptomyces sp. NBC_00249 TaxID=2975690 RepID=UPI002258AD95|nr:hypothetical protein [Streptomyces sp. NBC_00249]MCX5196404.1 hypothetical protein [Streptomyces sp. NBC_00249]
MIKNIAAAAALALSSTLLTCAPTQAAQTSYPLPLFGYAVYSNTPLVSHAPLLHPAYHPAYFGTYIVHGLR